MSNGFKHTKIWLLALALMAGSGASLTQPVLAQPVQNQPMSIQDKVAQKIKSGKAEFEATCAVCHGNDGKGHGPFSSFMTKRVPDLTAISKTNGGEFPFLRVYEILNGPGQIPGHDIRDMPVWGDYYKDHAAKDLGPFYNYSDVVTYVTTKTLSLLAYVGTLQEK